MAFTKVSSKYANVRNIFSLILAVKLPKQTRIKDYAIKFLDDGQPLYSPNYSLGFIELETWKAYIENILANGFIMPSKSSAKAPILFDKKPDNRLMLYVD